MNGHLREVRRDGACIWVGTPKSRMFTSSFSCLMFFFLGFFYLFMLDLGITAYWSEGGPESWLRTAFIGSEF